MHFGNNGDEHPPLDKAQRIAYLIAGYVRNTLSEKERDELDVWICEKEANEDTFLELIDPKFQQQGLEERHTYNSSLAIEKIREKLQFHQPVTPVKSIRKWLAPLAAAAILIIAVMLYWINNKEVPVVSNDATTQLASLLPAEQKATFSTQDGAVYALDQLPEQILARADFELDTNNHFIRYKPGSGNAEMHTISVPRGAQYQVQLPDGSLVWLNAESSIQFQSGMNKQERVVMVTGELFFDVKKDPLRKFIVRSNALQVEVLGTRFNVNLNAFDQLPKVFLQEGAITLSSSNNPVVVKKLIPGEMVTIQNNKLNITKPNEEQVLAWKNGWFEFSNASIEEIMEEVKRWYNVDIQYETKINDRFTASIERNLPAAGLLDLLQMTGKVSFEYKDSKIIVKP
ncbi:FecR family protein [Flavihumibacter sp. UBA7668]|uniref:FecR family protein n=1 Tax=Flavihumibacter sp. UBA7668 TaxID=1946542 RepID=UPI0025C68167|nr:FecR family protein [Flavihumibacter sp. UBA7668]